MKQMTKQDIKTESMLRTGTLLRGVYRIDDYLSSGGFGKTYVATNVEFNERVAIKEFFMRGVNERDNNQVTVSVSNAENKTCFIGQREKFKKEARRLRQLDNPHIVKVHDLFEENGTAYYVMDFIDGESLSERLKRTDVPIPESEVLQFLPQILDALKTVHNAKLWHLDLKPANIMVDKKGVVKLIDFGSSKQIDPETGKATTKTDMTYTEGYAPREQMEADYSKIGSWTDIYALGATLFTLLTNQHPPKPLEIDDDFSEDKHVALPMPNVSENFKKLIIKMMKTNRKQRPQKITDVDLSLLAYTNESNGEPTVIPPTLFYEKPTNERPPSSPPNVPPISPSKMPPSPPPRIPYPDNRNNGRTPTSNCYAPPFNPSIKKQRSTNIDDGWWIIISIVIIVAFFTLFLVLDSKGYLN